MTNVIFTCRLDRSGVEAGVEVGAVRNGTRSEGGCTTKRGRECTTATFHFPLFLFGFFVLDRPTRAAPAERGKTGATPSCAKTRPFRNRPQISSLDALGIRAESRVFRAAGLTSDQWAGR